MGQIVVVVAAERERVARPMIRRCLGIEGGERFIAETAAESVDEVLIRMRSERWLSADHAKVGN
ncbi:MAG: hypothetical protein ACR2OO_04900 [Thermomicrobiales bacterium]